MKEPVIWELEVPEVTLEELFTAQGGDYNKYNPNSSVVKINRKILEEAANLVKPAVIWKEMKISGAGEKELFLENDIVLKSKLLAMVAGNAEKLILYAMTVGAVLDNRIAEYNKAGEMMEAFTLDAAGSAFLSKSASTLMKRFEEMYETEDVSLTFPLGPGHSYWEGLEDVRNIINLLQGDKIGITLTDTNLMIPQKSLAFVIGVGNKLQDFKGKVHCDFCHMQKTCNMRSFGVKC